MIGWTNNLNIKTPEYHNGYSDGFKDCLNTLENKVKKMGKRYHKEFLKELKNLGGDFTTCSATFTTHECNCEYCSLK